MVVSFIGGGSGENQGPVASHWQTLSHGTDCTGSCKSDYRMVVCCLQLPYDYDSFMR